MSEVVPPEEFTFETAKRLLMDFYFNREEPAFRTLSGAKKFYRFAEKHSLSRLKVACGKVISSFIDGSNALEVLLLADECNDEKLKNQALAFICNHPADCSSDATSLADLQRRPNLLAELMSHKPKLKEGKENQEPESSVLNLSPPTVAACQLGEKLSGQKSTISNDEQINTRQSSDCHETTKSRKRAWRDSDTTDVSDDTKVVGSNVIRLETSLHRMTEYQLRKEESNSSDSTKRLFYVRETANSPKRRKLDSVLADGNQPHAEVTGLSSDKDIAKSKFKPVKSPFDAANMIYKFSVRQSFSGILSGVDSPKSEYDDEFEKQSEESEVEGGSDEEAEVEQDSSMDEDSVAEDEEISLGDEEESLPEDEEVSLEEEDEESLAEDEEISLGEDTEESSFDGSEQEVFVEDEDESLSDETEEDSSGTGEKDESLSEKEKDDGLSDEEKDECLPDEEKDECLPDEEKDESPPDEEKDKEGSGSQ